jgi:hypothetical protein
MKFPQLYLRVMRPEPTRISAIMGNPNYKNQYVRSSIHTEEGQKAQSSSKGINVQIHHVKGYIPDRHLRVA